MACNRPDGDCTGCGGCNGSGGTTPSVPLPRCNDVVLVDGVYTNATVTVVNGCITTVTAGEPEVYTPDFCCDGGGGGEGTPGPRGFPGPAGEAATLDILPLGLPDNANWVLNVSGNTAHRTLEFKPPLPRSDAELDEALDRHNGLSTAPYDKYGFTLDKGIVQAIQKHVRNINAHTQPGSLTANMVTILAGWDPNTVDNDAVFELKFNFDGLYSPLDSRLSAVEATQAGDTSAITNDIADIRAWMADMYNYDMQITGLMNALIGKMNAVINAIESPGTLPKSVGGQMGNTVPQPPQLP